MSAASKVPLIVISIKNDQAGRKTKAQRRIVYHGLSDQTTFLDAVTPGDSEEYKKYAVNFENRYPTAKYVVACFASHLKALRWVVEHHLGEAIILEDDFLLHNDFNRRWEKIHPSIPEGTPLVMLSYIDNRVQPITVGKYFAPIQGQWGALAYWVTEGGAKEILSRLDKSLEEVEKMGLNGTSECITQSAGNSGGLLVSTPLAVEDPGTYSTIGQHPTTNSGYYQIFGYENYTASEGVMT